MRIAIVSPQPVPPQRGGAERAWDGLEAAIGRLTDHHIEQVRLPVDERRLAPLVDGYRRFAELDLSGFDQVITSKYPAWMVRHPAHTLLMFHPLRGLYDTYDRFGLPERVGRADYRTWRVLDVVRGHPTRARLADLWSRFEDLVAAVGPDHPSLAVPGPLAREVVRWLDRAALVPGADGVARHLALSRTVAGRPGYFPAGITPEVVYLPSDLPGTAGPGQDHFFTASRLDAPKRIDLLIDAVRIADTGVPLVIAGTGSAEDDLRARAAGDPQVRFAGRVDDNALAQGYANALATLFVPLDEDLGLVTLESWRCATPVVTTLDAGGPAELVAHAVSGLVAAPDPASLAGALDRLAAHPRWARRLGAGGRRQAEHITWERAVARALRPPPAGSGAAGGGPGRPPPRQKGTGRRLRVVTVSTYGIWPPQGGGPLRYVHLYGAAARHCDIEVVSLVNPPFETTRTELVPGLTETAVAMSGAHKAADDRLSGSLPTPVTDIVAGRDITASPAYLAELGRATDGADAVLLSHPFLLPALDAIGCRLPMVFDAHNVEADLKRAVLPATPEVRELMAFLDRIERRATVEAEAVVTCSAEDAEILAARAGRPLDRFTVIANGTDVSVPVASPAVRRSASGRWRRRWVALARPTVAPRAVALFLASWHQPNIDAGRALLALAPERPDVVFVLAGRHSDALRGGPVPPNVVLAGAVTDTAKGTLLELADVAVNPMVSGSGTNLKVVEYLARGVPTVSTPFGARGLEGAGDVLALAGVEDFPAAIGSVLDDPEAAQHRAARARALVEERYGWPVLGDRLAGVLAGVAAMPDRNASTSDRSAVRRMGGSAPIRSQR